MALAVGAVLVAAPDTLSAVRGIFDDPAPPQVSAGDAIPPDTPIPTLSADQQAAATALIAKDAALRGVLGAGGYTVAELGPWTGDQGELLGAAVVLQLRAPLNGERAFPLIRFDHSATSTPPYRVRVEHLIVRDATELQVLVDFSSGRVVSLQPDGANANVSPGQDVVSLPPAGD